MKVNFLLIFLLFFGNYQFAQTAIDYNNFDERKASLALAKAFCNFKDTTTTHDLYLDYAKYSEMSPDLMKNKKLRKVRWNEWIYSNISTKNCDKTMEMGTKIDHPDIEKWVETNQKLITEEVTKNQKTYYSDHRISYKEVLFQHNSKKYKTYEELANVIIQTLDKSRSHSGLMRGKDYSISEYEKGFILTSAFACSVKYNKGLNYIKCSLNVIGIQ